MKIMLVGPKGTAQTMQKTIPFTGQYSNNLDVIEIPTDLDAPVFEESKDTDQIFCFDSETNRVTLQDLMMTIYPLRASTIERGI